MSTTDVELSLSLKLDAVTGQVAAVEKQVAEGLRKGAEQGSKEAAGIVGQAMAKQLGGELILTTVSTVAASFDGLAKSGINAAGMIARGFFQGGPVGAALGAATAGVSVLADMFSRAKAEAKAFADATAADLQRVVSATAELANKQIEFEKEAERIRLARAKGITVQQAAVALQSETQQRLIDLARQKVADAQRQLDASMERYGKNYDELFRQGGATPVGVPTESTGAPLDQLSAAQVIGERRKREALEATIKAQHEALKNGEQALRTTQAQADSQKEQRLTDHLDKVRQIRLEAWKQSATDMDALRADYLARQKEDADFDEELQWQQLERLANEKQAHDQTVRDAEREHQAWLAQIKQDAANAEFQREQEKSKTIEGIQATSFERIAALVEEMSGAGQMVADAAAQYAGQALESWLNYSDAANAANEAAGLSAADKAAEADKALQATLAAISKEAATQALFETAKGIGAGASGNAAVATAHFAAATAYGVVAVGAGLGARGIGESRGATSSERRGDTGGGGGTTGGTATTININTNGQLFSTRAETEAAVLAATRRAERRA